MTQIPQLQILEASCKECGDTCPKHKKNKEKVIKIMTGACLGVDPNEINKQSETWKKIVTRLLENEIKPCVACSQLTAYQKSNDKLKENSPEEFAKLNRLRVLFQGLVNFLIQGKEKHFSDQEKRFYRKAELFEFRFPDLYAEFAKLLDSESIHTMLATENDDIQFLMERICANIQGVSNRFTHDTPGVSAYSC